MNNLTAAPFTLDTAINGQVRDSKARKFDVLIRGLAAIPDLLQNITNRTRRNRRRNMPMSAETRLASRNPSLAGTSPRSERLRRGGREGNFPAFNRRHLLLASAAALFAFLGAKASAAGDSQFSVPAHIDKLLDLSCYSCHDDVTRKGDVRLDNLKELDLPSRLDLLNRVQEQVFLNTMPKSDKLDSGDSDTLLKWVSEKLAEHKASKLEDKLRYYKYANCVSHEKLFSGEIKEMPFTPARRWKINEYIYRELIYNLYRVPFDKRRDALPVGYVQPFQLPKESGVAYYDIEPVGGGEFLTLLDNAKYTVSRQLIASVEQTDAYIAPPPPKNFKTNPIFKPKKTDAEFAKLVLGKGVPADADLEAAIARQFQLALQRPPRPEEMTEYLGFMKQAIKSNGVLPALEKVMVSVLMEPDFLYRSEFGDGKPDAHGRTMLTPREASYALSYALTDSVPDAALLVAVGAGKLSTKADYEREVIRMLNDDSLAKPRILRFFQDYFGYYNVFAIFKDEVRFGGGYNPHRASTRVMQWAVPGKVTREADALVTWILKQDRDVLKQLLTTEKYFVHHTGNNEEMSRFFAEAVEATGIIQAQYDHLSKASKSGKKAAIAKLNDQRIDGRKFSNYFQAFNPDLPDRQPMPLLNDFRTYAIKMYNLNHETWSYETEQPFKVQNRMGMLTHPAWLTSFSANTETDIIRRGKWIQEKLLGGVIPDVPITVEAKIPEAHDKTLRQRLASVTEHRDCWSCHEKMNPLGYPFEAYDDFGRYRRDEMLEHEENIVKTVKKVLPGTDSNLKLLHTYRTLPVDAAGALIGTGDKNLDGGVNDALELIQRLSQSDRVRQVFIRNVFRYFMGRNEMLSDSKTLIEADKAYVESGGSFKALTVSLLTSDSFMYRK